MCNKKYLKYLMLASVIFFSSVAVFFLQNVLEKNTRNIQRNEIKKIEIGENIFQAEIADTFSKRSQGLSGRKALCENCAMLFIFSEKSRLSFWMKGMNFDLDMLWIDKNEIVYIAKNVSREKELERIEPKNEADKVLEIGAGLTDELGIKVGDRVKF
jgi:uncharacterized membrane protein (UPF0127 family)